MMDDQSLGVSVGKGAQIIVGNINNPITLLCEQIGIKYRNSNFFCPLIDENGRCFTLERKELDDQVDLHYNNVLDAIRNKYQSDRNFPDVPLEGRSEIISRHEDSACLLPNMIFSLKIERRKISKIPIIPVTNFRHFTEMFSKMSSGLLSAADLDSLYTPEFEKLLDFHLGNLEFSCGTHVSNLSAKDYDHNEKFGNFAGEHAVITDGAQRIIDFLATGLDIRLNCPVKCIDWGRDDRKVKIFFENAEQAAEEFDKVVITTSLSVLKSNHSKMFVPPLPIEKQKAIDDLGAGLIEKIAVKFDRRFWDTVDADGLRTEYFGKVSDCKTDRSLFNIFYDFSGKVC